MLIPANNHILVEILSKKSDAYIPKSKSDSQQEGVVLAVGDSCIVSMNYNGRTALEKGDRVRWEKYAEADGVFDYNGKKVSLIKDSQVMGIYV